MTEKELLELIAFGREQRAVEFKGHGARTDKSFLVTVVRAVLAMANLRDGGTVVVGVQEDRTGLRPDGLYPEERDSWNYDDTADSIAQYADPFVAFELHHISAQGKDFVVLRIDEFEEMPVICKKGYEQKLRNGAIYVRTVRKPESVEVPSHVDMRLLVELAMQKGLRKFLGQAYAAGLLPARSDSSDDDDAFANQLEDLA